ncbi:transcription elongation factor GreA [Candidatus Roizmanbacteria bacterium CG_4_8_14_3_um_filter_36_10]|uniref:Transcription elongation factor GreA n=3 Tax=Candidatus Roizmaniibacteriota TaxID=1752723 RepID=A0A2M8F2M1_9BACT|nr:MAG: transcription elongation factor GreA [Candidatus Roizmanbacteria bacterium CG11_big_fil_rev_8_21_14_0_20_35_14]PJC33536.1 MAG: transcription elongation factor GreA [Candidatus Roizmanbacteria bacterium CG_4_9_14_0_2_um_filter_36_12]PJC81809.1 MAG: transcription elongation factor GreA [Candidatus Roizmanbacteria bacterium CG_4_8_14_3_um_filter_36_10]
MKNTQLTKEGFENLKKELDDLLTIKRPRAIERLHKARSMGDLSENSEYNAAKEGLAFVERRVQEIEEIIKMAQVVENHNHQNQVEIGSSVTVEVDGKKEMFQVVGEFEADPFKKKLSHTSPIGQALTGKKVGDWVEVEVPAGKIKYKIVEIK